MTLKRATIFVSGNVQMAGFRTFVKNIADSLDVKGYAENLSDGRVKIVCEGEEMGIAELANAIKTKASELSRVEDVQIEYEEYAGEFLDFERRGEDVPKKATLDDLLKVMISIDNKFGRVLESLGK
jgi:acylphosphatase